MPESPPPYSKPLVRPREPSTLDQIRDGVSRLRDVSIQILERLNAIGDDAAAAARRSQRLESELAELAQTLMSKQPSVRPPVQPRSWADDSQRIEIPKTVEDVLDKRELDEMRSKRNFAIDTIKLVVAGSGGIALWEFTKFIWQALQHH